MYELKNKTKYCIDDIIGEVIRDPAHSEAIANYEPPRYIISSEAGLKGMLMKIKENAANYRDKMGRKMREDAPVLVAGVASFPREIAEKDPDLYARWESLTVAYLQGKYGDNLRAVVMHNDEEQPHIHFYVYSDTEVNAKALHYGHKAKKEFHSSIQGVPRRLSRPSRDPLRNGPPRAKEAAPDTRRVEGTKRARYESRSSGECGARFRCDQGEGGA